jgi:superfamily II DNA or RNA helicase
METSEEFDAAVQRSRRAELAPFLILDVQPRPHQEEILEDLAAERANGHMRNLVVAATGTGKTIVAALGPRKARPSSCSSSVVVCVELTRRNA